MTALQTGFFRRGRADQFGTGTCGYRDIYVSDARYRGGHAAGAFKHTAYGAGKSGASGWQRALFSEWRGGGSKSDPGSCKRGSGRWHLVYKANLEAVLSVMK